MIAVHPGIIETNILSSAGINWINPLLSVIRSDVETGAMTQLYAATHDDIVAKDLKGVYLVPVGKVGVMSSVVNDDLKVKEFWDWTELMLQERKFQSEWNYKS